METNLDQLRAAMAATNALFNDEVFAKGNYAAFDHIYTFEARILPPGAAMITGRQGIKDYWAATIAAVQATSAVLSSVEVTPTADGIIEIGNAVLTIAGGAELEAKYVVCWKQEDGAWKWDIDIWNFSA